MALLPHPFIWGPVGGAEAAPKPFWQDFSRRGRIYETLRALAQSVGERDPFVGLTARRSAVALATTEETETLSKMGESHILLHPSLHDSGGFVCTEMMGVGRPTICLDLGGPATQVTPQTGIKVAATDPDRSVKGLAESIVCLAHDRELRDRLGRAGQKRVREIYDWNIKGKFFAELCEAVHSNLKPRFLVLRA